ncbi:MAG: hypothetical protein HN467_08215, partial [Opitutae bacterium]|nr:hypothetical protein [Opitutae bacterium]
MSYMNKLLTILFLGLVIQLCAEEPNKAVAVPQEPAKPAEAKPVQAPKPPETKPEVVKPAEVKTEVAKPPVPKPETPKPVAQPAVVAKPSPAPAPEKPVVAPVVATPVVAKPPIPNFHSKIRPILEVSCIQCHGIEKQKGKLRLDQSPFALKGGETGPAIVPEDFAKSLLIERIALAADHDDIMPPKGDPLSPDQVKLLKDWIAGGAPWPKDIELRAKTRADLVREQLFANKKLVAVEVFPSKVSLETSSDHHKLVVLATYDDDTTRDVTLDATFSISDATTARLDRNGIFPVKDGSTSVRVTFAGRNVDVPITVKDASTPRNVSFRLDVMPVFMRAGCNTGSCHGSARGQDGFMLSLFG